MLTNASVHPTLPVTDLERAKTFYTKQLGLKVDGAVTEGHLRLACGGGTALTLYQRDKVTPADHTACSFEVKDVDKVFASLREQGVTFEDYDMPGIKTEDGIAEMGDVRGGWFKDPDGHTIGVFGDA